MFETERTMLGYFQTYEDVEIKSTLPLVNFNVFINKLNQSVNVVFDSKIEGLGRELKDFVIDVTNDPKTDHKFCLTNLGYYSIRLCGINCKVFFFNDKTIFSFKITDFTLDLNMSIWLPQINSKNMLHEFLMRDENMMFLRFEFKNELNHDLLCSVWRDGKLKKFNMDLLSIDNNYSLVSESDINVEDLLKEHKMI